MEATTLGMNRTGAAVSPIDTRAMTEAADTLSPNGPRDTSALDAERRTCIQEAESLGSIPPPASMQGVVKMGMTKLKGGTPSVLLDKLGERAAFERAGTRLYEALIAKFQALQATHSPALATADQMLRGADGLASAQDVMTGETPLQTLMRIRAEELAHFRMLGATIEAMGGDPTAQTPCADVTATASMGLVQVVTDPRTTLAQSLDAILTAELTDNAAWELLIHLADDAGESDIVNRFQQALVQEQQHLAVIKGWLTQLVTQEAGSPAV